MHFTKKVNKQCIWLLRLNKMHLTMVFKFCGCRCVYMMCTYVSSNTNVPQHSVKVRGNLRCVLVLFTCLRQGLCCLLALCIRLAGLQASRGLLSLHSALSAERWVTEFARLLFLASCQFRGFQLNCFTH